MLVLQHFRFILGWKWLNYVRFKKKQEGDGEGGRRGGWKKKKFISRIFQVLQFQKVLNQQKCITAPLIPFISHLWKRIKSHQENLYFQVKCVQAEMQCSGQFIFFVSGFINISFLKMFCNESWTNATMFTDPPVCRCFYNYKFTRCNTYLIGW